MRGFFSVFALVSVVVAVTACAPGMQPLLDDYNSLFQVTLAGQEAAGGTDDWMADLYRISLINRLNLHAPDHCSSYKWELLADSGNPNSHIPQGFDIGEHGGNTYRLDLYFKNAGFASGGSYELVCTVEKGGKIITDRCTILLVD